MHVTPCVFFLPEKEKFIKILSKLLTGMFNYANIINCINLDNMPILALNLG